MCTRYISATDREIESVWKIDRRNTGSWPRQLFPRSRGPFIRRARDAIGYERELVVGRPRWCRLKMRPTESRDDDDIDGAGRNTWGGTKGLRAAQKVLDAAGVTDVQAARALWDLEGWYEAGIPNGMTKPTAQAYVAAEALQEARAAAIRACCEKWSAEPPGDWHLDVVF